LSVSIGGIGLVSWIEMSWGGFLGIFG